jgi:hypothetical protein
MRRKPLCLVALAGAGALAAVIALKPSFGPVPQAQAASAARPDMSALPVAQVILYSSGVGYFQREGEVEGSQRIDLSFPVADINDLLKSMVLQDLGGGHISAVSYDSQAPIDKTLRSFAIDLTSNPSFAQILHQGRGEKVEVVLQQSNTTQPGTLTGTILGVEKQKQPTGKEGTVEVELLNLWCAEGIRSVKLSEVQRLRFLNPVMDSEVKKALEVLALSHDTQKKAVSLSFSGEGKRAVRVGYVVENPIWKTSYRLVLNKEGKDGKDAKPVLQGWAVVENPTDEDWNAVRMALVSGRPISFRMNLYDPLYLQRPLVEPELFASLRPPTYTGSLDKATKELAAADPGKPMESLRRQAGKGEGKGRGAGVDAAEQTYFGRSGANAARKLMDKDMDLSKGIASAATATEMGDYFQYGIEHAVTLPRQKSALLPIVQQPVEADRVSIYNEAVQAKHPLLGLKFKNTTGLHLMQGPITVFEGSAYAGDARILDLQPKEQRLLSYAVDLGTEVEAVSPNGTERITKVKVTRGIIEATRLLQQSKVYTIKNRSEHHRMVVLEHPYRPEFKLVSKEEPTERARDVYRFDVPLKPGVSVKWTVTEERSLGQSISLSNTDDQGIRVFLNANSAVISPKVKEAVQGALDLKGKVSLTQRELQQKNRQLNDIVQDQTRLRANLREMPPTAEAYKRYLKKFDDQETEIEQLRETIKNLQNTEHQHKLALDAYLTKLNVE